MDFSRYSRQIVIPNVGTSGQLKLSKASVLIIGLGGLGSPISLYLSAAGIGKIGLIDADLVDASNLQRQILYQTSQIGKSKAICAKERLSALNPDVEFHLYDEKLNAKNAEKIISLYDIIIDGTDNFETRFLSHDTAYALGKPWIMGAINQFDGQVGIFIPNNFPEFGNFPCYHCLVPHLPDPTKNCNCAQAGVFGVLPGIVGSLQATETLKLILGIGDLLLGKMLYVDALRMKFSQILLAKDPNCPFCSQKKHSKMLFHFSKKTKIPEISAADFMNLYHKNPSEIRLLDVRNPEETAEGHIPEAILIPLNLLKERAYLLPPETPGKPLYINCLGGSRSAQAVEILQSIGRNDAISIAGGYRLMKNL